MAHFSSIPPGPATPIAPSVWPSWMIGTPPGCGKSPNQSDSALPFFTRSISWLVVRPQRAAVTALSSAVLGAVADAPWRAKNREDAPQGRPQQLQLRCWLSPQMPRRPRRAVALRHLKFAQLARSELLWRHQRAMRKPRAPQTTLSEIDYASISPPPDDSGKSCSGRPYQNRPPNRYLYRYPWSSSHAYALGGADDFKRYAGNAGGSGAFSMPVASHRRARSRAFIAADHRAGQMRRFRRGAARSRGSWRRQS
jgi:hypothetical protein